MRFLAIDTSAGCSLGLVDFESQTGGVKVLAERYLADARAHAEQLSLLLAQMVREAGFENLRAAQVDYIAVGRGPAPFTGLRAGLVVARTLGYALGVPVIGVCSLAALARAILMDPEKSQICGQRTLLITADARRKELYAAAYCCSDAGVLIEVLPPSVNKPTVFAQMSQENDWLVAGVGPRLYSEHISGLSDIGLVVQVADLAQLAADNLESRDISPLYLRRPDIHQG